MAAVGVSGMTKGPWTISDLRGVLLGQERSSEGDVFRKEGSSGVR